MAKKHLTIILFLCMVSILLCGCAGTEKYQAEKQITNTNKTDNVYKVSEFLDDAQYDEYMNDAGILFGKLKAFQCQLADSSEFAFHAFANNLIEVIDHEIPDECVVNHDTEYEAESGYEMDGERITAAEAIQVSDRFFDLFPLKICEGRSFEPSDFHEWNADAIPVILGSAYRDSFHTGDTFEGYYICERRSFTVIGFTDTASDFYLHGSSRMVPYSRFIIMPFEKIGEDSFSARAILLQQINGFLVTHKGRESAVETIRKYLTESGLANWREAIIVLEKSLPVKN